ncbi:MAG: DEAD/DEAH box helicase [Paludibacteraceae bacterium]|nr:DEAD/DEAH box helicase [Paludibacteraceae bacterium]MCK9615609.1 DEAD/DEAH box helicase [Candidatus Omnitrophota bacterium]
MRTEDFTYFKFPFYEFNPIQSKVIPLVEKEGNLIVSFKPGTGKTAIAEACFAYHLKSSSQRVAYICPFRALANQKAESWKEKFHGYGVKVISGDSSTSLSDLVEKDRIIIFTTESFDMHIKNCNEYSCICFDEAHLVGDSERGKTYESAVIKAAETSRIIFLSGTLTNAKDLAKWIKIISGKTTYCCESQWTPNKFDIRYHYVERYKEIETAVKLVKEYQNTKTIIFVHSKLVGKSIMNELKKNKIRAVFHNSTLPEGKRKRYEDLFENIYSGIDVIVATSTLAAGVNL